MRAVSIDGRPTDGLDASKPLVGGRASSLGRFLDQTVSPTVGLARPTTLRALMTFEQPPPPPEPVAPELWVSVRKRRFKVMYDSDNGSVELVDEKGRRVHSTVLTTATTPLVLTDDDQLVLGRQPYAVAEDQLGMALAFVHFVNLRIPRNALQHAQYDDGLDALLQPLEHMVRFQYAVVNVGMFNSADRMAGVLGAAGENGWELVTVYDKGSNWMSGMEKGFLLLKRRVPDGATVRQWCITIKN